MSRPGQVIGWYALVLVLVAVAVVVSLGLWGETLRGDVASWLPSGVLASGGSQWGSWADIEEASAAVVLALAIVSLGFWVLARGRKKQGVAPVAEESKEKAVVVGRRLQGPVVHLFLGEKGVIDVPSEGVEAQMRLLGKEIDSWLKALEEEMVDFKPQEVQVGVGISAAGEAGIVVRGAPSSLTLVFRRDRRASGVRAL